MEEEIDELNAIQCKLRNIWKVVGHDIILERLPGILSSADDANTRNAHIWKMCNGKGWGYELRIGLAPQQMKLHMTRKEVESAIVNWISK